jgi:hypothetical protein
MGFGRLIRVGSWRGDPEAAIYVVEKQIRPRPSTSSRSAPPPTMATILKI